MEGGDFVNEIKKKRLVKKHKEDSKAILYFSNENKTIDDLIWKGTIKTRNGIFDCFDDCD